MAKLRVTLIDELRNRRLKVDLPDDAAMEKLLPALAEKLGLPPADYQWTHEATGRALGGDQTLASFGVGEGETLRLAAAREEAPAVPQPAVELVDVAEAEVVPVWQKAPVWGWAAVGGVILLAVLLAVAALAYLAGRGAKPEPTPTVVAEVPTPAAKSAAVPQPTATLVVPTLTPLPPTDTPVPPTDTPMPTSTPRPTATPAPPTATPVPPTATSVPPMPMPEVGKLPDLGGSEVRIAVENAWPPFNFVDEKTGQGAGWDYETWAAICKLIKCKPIFVETAWEGIFEAAAAGEFDVAADGITITEERKKIVAFSDPYMESGQVVLVRADETDIKDKDTLVSLGDKTVGVPGGITSEDTAIELVGRDRVRSLGDFGQAIAALMAGEVDAVIMDDIIAPGFVARNPGKLKIAGGRFTQEGLGFVFQQGSDLIEPVNAALAALKSDGTMDGFFIKWFVEHQP